jgi:putative FmdB family regulatory protein
MPIYGYRCNSCGHELEVLQKLSDQPLKKCPVCGGELRKLLYPAGVIFKGSGFYSTDYKGSNKSAEGASSNGSGSSSEKTSSDKSGDGTSAKPAAESKAESKPSQSDSSA